METIQKQPEIETPETEQSQEQTPEKFRQSLEIFNKYREVSEEEAKAPEHTMRFDKAEQELVVGLRGTLNEFIQHATENQDSVSIANMFDKLDEAIRAQADDHSEETLDQLYLVATKMRYNLQVRFDRALRAEAEKDTSSSTTYDWIPKFTFAAADPVSGSSKAGSGKHRSQFMFKHVIGQNEPLDDDSDDEPVHYQPYPAPQLPPSLEVQAHGKILEYTGGQAFADLDTKEQGRVRRRIAQDFHPDKGDDSNLDLYKEMNAQTAHKNGQQQTETTSTSQPEPKPTSQAETPPETHSEV